ncbi:TraU family protein [Rugamonas aquatica]|uniref:Conjugal transfer protein n=1 Tax=Rugamonas aquatica TaxID=2743357 RepID=A0A6A7N6B5_9BURK|nr:TraU family protein [Rugamonas aquatica]MQA40590.1 conjugal transfer protein [Rugamonas aquatica]
MKRLWMLVVALLAWGGGAQGAGLSTCVGRMPNLIADICWSCMMPISLGPGRLMDVRNQEDNGSNPSNPVCSCVVKPTIGLSTGFWEPARIVEVVRRPYCLVSLGGIDVDPGIPAPEAGRSAGVSGVTSEQFYQAHYYTTTVAQLLSVLMDSPCMEKGTFDLAYMTELDPLWNDDMLTAILSPESLLFANPIAVAACAADCVAATAGFGSSKLFWCAGCQGSLYPLNGHAGSAGGGIRGAELMVQRLMAKLHRCLVAWGWEGEAALCGPYLMPEMDKQAYKVQLLYPTPQTYGGVGGRCCQPFGRSTVLWGAGREYPVVGEDFTFLLFRKRNCCAGI